MIYLFIGEDSPGKDIQLKAIRNESLDKGIEQFNQDTLYSKELSLKTLQEKLIYLPAGNSKRIIIVKEAQALKEELKESILAYAGRQHKRVILILDFDKAPKEAGFINRIYKQAKVIRFKETKAQDAFVLNRSIALRRPDSALRVLNQLLKEGERPERIMGALRYAWERESASPLEMKRRLKLLLNCDIEIKTGRLKANFALEKLVISLCAAGKPLH